MSLPLVVGLGSVDPALVTGGLDPGVHCVAEPDARQPATTAGPSPAFEAVIDRDLLDRMPALRVIARNGVGVEKVDLVNAEQCGIPVVVTPGRSEERRVGEEWRCRWWRREEKRRRRERQA